MKTIKTLLFLLLFMPLLAQAAGKYDNPDTIFVALDGTGEFRTVDEAIEVCRAFMDYLCQGWNLQGKTDYPAVVAEYRDLW